MTSNSLVAPLRSLFTNSDTGYSEYTLIRSLVDSGVLKRDYAATPLELFRTHFRLMNALYLLQQEWLAENRYLHISVLEIRLNTWVPELGEAHTPALSIMRDFYLDWRHYEAATAETVDSLLNDFWRRYAAQGVDEHERSEALRILGLTEPVDFPAIKQRYRRLAMAHHPDRGGDDKSLQIINNAMAVLAQAYPDG